MPFLFHLCTDEAGLQEGKKRGDNRVKETKRRMIQDVVSRVILEGDEEAASQIDPDALLADPAAVVGGKKTLVKQMTVKFSGAGGSASNLAAAASGAPGGSSKEVTGTVLSEEDA
jgi:hypothetical protein